jgi:hypothetical protein
MRLKMRLKYILVSALAGLAVLSAPAFAKKQSANGKGVYCSQAADNFYIPASAFSAKVRAQMRKGEKVNVNIAGYGPVSCRVY